MRSKFSKVQTNYEAFANRRDQPSSRLSFLSLANTFSLLSLIDLIEKVPGKEFMSETFSSESVSGSRSEVQEQQVRSL